MTIIHYPPLGQAADMQIGERLRKVRTEQGMTAKNLSGLSGVPEKTIYRIETGEVTDPRISTLEPLIRALNCSADEILFDVQDFTKMGRLRQLFLKFGDLDEHQQDFLLEVIQKVSLALGMEKHFSDSLAKGDYTYIPPGESSSS